MDVVLPAMTDWPFNMLPASQFGGRPSVACSGLSRLPASPVENWSSIVSCLPNALCGASTTTQPSNLGAKVAQMLQQLLPLPIGIHALLLPDTASGNKVSHLQRVCVLNPSLP